MNEDACSFSMWLRPDLEETFDLKFQVSAGRGVIRISRPGVLVDPPAMNDGEVTGLTLADLHATRFLLLPSRGKRQSYHFSDLEFRHLSGLLVGDWNVLEYSIIEGQRSFLPPSFEDDETSLITTIPLEAMRPTFQVGAQEEDRLRTQVQHLTAQLAAERERSVKLSHTVEGLARQLKQLSMLFDDDELL